MPAVYAMTDHGNHLAPTAAVSCGCAATGMLPDTEICQAYGISYTVATVAGAEDVASRPKWDCVTVRFDGYQQAKFSAKMTRVVSIAGVKRKRMVEDVKKK